MNRTCLVPVRFLLFLILWCRAGVWDTQGAQPHKFQRHSTVALSPAATPASFPVSFTGTAQGGRLELGWFSTKWRSHWPGSAVPSRRLSHTLVDDSLTFRGRNLGLGGALFRVCPFVIYSASDTFPYLCHSYTLQSFL